jgi:Pup-like protein
MPKTEQVTRHTERDSDDTIDTDIPTRPDNVTETLTDTDALLDEIDSVLETEVIEHELTLADLIRGGSLLQPQIHGSLRNCEGTCALGAAEDEAKRLGLL